MAQFVDATLKEVEQFVIQTGEPQIVYGVGPACVSKSASPMEDLKAFKFYQNVDDAQKAFVALANAKQSCACDEIEFYLDENGYLQCRNIRCLDDVIAK